jgi:Zn-dependent protease/CBS domain-containing protein
VSVKIGKISGIIIGLHYSWFIILALLSWSLATGYLPSQYPNQTNTFYWGVGVIASLTLFISILLHEIAHSLVAQREGMTIQRITLHFFGGVSEMTEEAESPGGEIKMAVVGPLTSFVIGLGFLALWYSGGGGLPTYFGAIFQYASFANIALAFFNSIPAFPMDGGRILRALIWKWRGKLLSATRTATTVSRIISYLFMGLGIFSIFALSTLNGLWLLVIGFIISGNATASLNQTMITEALGGVKVEEIMTRDVITVEPHLTIQQVVDRFFKKHRSHGYPVEEEGRIIGLVCEHDVREINVEHWDEYRVDDIMTPREELITIDPDDNAADALMKMAKNDVGRLPVMEEGELVGIITRSDVARAVKRRTEAGEEPQQMVEQLTQ